MANVVYPVLLLQCVRAVANLISTYFPSLSGSELEVIILVSRAMSKNMFSMQHSPNISSLSLKHLMLNLLKLVVI